MCRAVADAVVIVCFGARGGRREPGMPRCTQLMAMRWHGRPVHRPGQRWPIKKQTGLMVRHCELSLTTTSGAHACGSCVSGQEAPHFDCVL
jgi:hypothetical protein